MWLKVAEVARLGSSMLVFLDCNVTVLGFNPAPEVGTKSVIAITLRYVFALSRNASTLRRKVIALGS
jgi:hypothetical protein